MDNIGGLNYEKYVEILEAITAARAAMVDPEKSEKEFARNAVKIAYKSGTDAELAAAEAAYKAAEEKYAAECKHNEDLKIALEILKDNAANAFFAESIGTICTIWNKYAGKPHGEKTAEKSGRNFSRPWALGCISQTSMMMLI